MRRARSAAALLALAAVAAAPLPARAAAPPPEPKPVPAGPLWATLNVCDSVASPDQVGVRGQMPGDGHSRHQLYMRFRLQYAGAGGRWLAVGPAADSGWIRVGTAGVRSGQAGTTFTLVPPDSGFELLRGMALFQWRGSDGRVLRRARRLTTGGHANTKGADPPGFSAATCRLAP